MMLVTEIMYERLPWLWRPNPLALAWIQSTVSGAERSCSHSRETPVAISMTVFKEKGKELRSEIHGVERGGEVAYGLATVTRTGVVLVLRRRVGGSFLGGGGRYCCNHPRKWGEVRRNALVCGW
jgi:hypothetical protein